MPVPPTVSNWLTSAYPSLKLKPDWLSACCEQIQTQHPQLRGPELIQKIQGCLLDANLADCCALGAMPLRDLADTQSAHVATERGGVLVQIESIFEIGHSTLSVSDAHQQRKEDAKMGLDRVRVVGNIEEDTDDPKAPAKYPRAMLMLQVSDGFHSFKAMEYKKVPQISMDDTPIGCKLLLKGVRALRGVLLLEPGCVTVKGGRIKTLDDRRDDLIDAEIRQRLNLPEPEHTQAAETSRPGQPPPVPPVPAPPANQTPAASAPRPTGQQATANRLTRPVLPDQDDFDFNLLSDGWDEMDEMEAEARVTAAPTLPPEQAAEFDDFEDLTPEMLAAIEEAERASSVQPNASSSKSIQQPASSAPPHKRDASMVIDLDDSDEDGPLPIKKRAPPKKKPKAEIIELSSE